MFSNETILSVASLILISLAIRCGISLHPYSGYKKPPMYGDFEAQRHWQEITVNLPITDWYENTTENNLLYWGLDYPPLTAYHSFILGKIATWSNNSFVEYETSKGITDDQHKYFMRNTVLFADVIVYIPSLLLCCSIIYSLSQKQKKKLANINIFVLHVMISLFYPGQILIDNGHFQYNNISLGLTTFAIAALLLDKNLIGSFFFVLALNYKQMELYHALPFFFYLLGSCFNNGKTGRNSIASKVLQLSKISLVVITTFIIIWLPWLGSLQSVQQVIHRIFPIARGVFEDKVSNIWCIVNIFHKIKSNFTSEFMAKMCLATTVTSVMPSCIKLLLNPKKEVFLLSLINCSLSFFLFSFQEVVDESDGCGGKFNAIIVSPQFEGKSLIQRHRLVNSALSEELKQIHAFSQKTYTPQQWTEK